MKIRLSSWLRVGASVGLAGWVPMSLVPFFLAVMVLTSERGARYIAVIGTLMIPFVSSLIFFPVNAVVANFALMLLDRGTVTLSRKVRIAAMALTVIFGTANLILTILLSLGAYLLRAKFVGNPGLRALLIGIVTAGILGVIGAPFLFAALKKLRMERT